jgi:hypothetical protein
MDHSNSNSNSNTNYLGLQATGPPAISTFSREHTDQPSFSFPFPLRGTRPAGHGLAQPNAHTAAPLHLPPGAADKRGPLVSFPFLLSPIAPQRPRLCSPRSLRPATRRLTATPPFPVSLPPRPRSLVSPACAAPRLSPLRDTGEKPPRRTAAMPHASRPGRRDPPAAAASQTLAPSIRAPAAPLTLAAPCFPLPPSPHQQRRRRGRGGGGAAQGGDDAAAPELHQAYARMTTTTKPHALHGPDPPASARHRAKDLASKPTGEHYRRLPYPLLPA